MPTSGGMAGAQPFRSNRGVLSAGGKAQAIGRARLAAAGPLRNTGQYTTADVLDLRLKAVPVRAAAAVSTLTVSLFYLLAQIRTC